MSMMALIGRYVLIGLIWLALLAVIVVMAVFGALVEDSTIGVIMMLVIGSVIATLGLLSGTAEMSAMQKHETAVRKRKNAEVDAGNPDVMALLSDDDIAELRERLKGRLHAQIDGLDDADISSFESLLASTSKERHSTR